MIRAYVRAPLNQPTSRGRPHLRLARRFRFRDARRARTWERVQCNGPTNQRTEELKETGRRASNALVGIAAAGAFGRGRRGRGFAFGALLPGW
jgi:hypothetical protein